MARGGFLEQQQNIVASALAASPCNVLGDLSALYGGSRFGIFSEACELVGAKYPAIPLGLITVAALLPNSWNVRLVNRNTEELADTDLDWADMVMTGGMLFQQSDTLELIDMLPRSRPAGGGSVGPDATSSPHRYESSDFRVLGEVEDIISQFIADWERGLPRRHLHRAEIPGRRHQDAGAALATF